MRLYVTRPVLNILVENQIEYAKRLLQWSHTAIQNARYNILRARANGIRAAQLAEKAKATLYANHLIRGVRR